MGELPDAMPAAEAYGIHVTLDPQASSVSPQRLRLTVRISTTPSIQFDRARLLSAHDCFPLWEASWPRPEAGDGATWMDGDTEETRIVYIPATFAAHEVLLQIVVFGASDDPVVASVAFSVDSLPVESTTLPPPYGNGGQP
jgi:hypothetical protein